MARLRARHIASALLLWLACGRVDPPRDGAARDTASDRSPAVDVAGAPETAAGADAASCPPECVRAVVCCRSDCTGPAVNRGCCPCGADEVDSLSCSPARTCAPPPP